MFSRLQKFIHLGKESCFFWGARQTGKSTLLKELFSHAPYYDLLLSEVFERLSRQPQLLREDLLLRPSLKTPVVIDEIQLIPKLLNEIHWLTVNHGFQFIMCGSSPRKLKRKKGNLLGGRALRYELLPLVAQEIPDFDLVRALNHGLLPRHYLAKNSYPLLQAYVGEYLKEEIAAEAAGRSIPAFGDFLQAAAFSNGEIVNYSNIARECGVSSPTVKEYFQILVDTLVGRYVPSYRKRPKRRVLHAPKFYYFDLGLVNFLLKRGEIQAGGESFGKAFEHYIYQEIFAYSHYSGKNFPIYYWHTTSQLEVDFILGEHEVALEAKSSKNVGAQHLGGLKAFSEEYKTRHNIVVSLDPRPRLASGIHILPWQEFLEKLWAGKII
ncbi:AAA family ATPase [candidate division WOR-1 bacterium RIFCSPLOWO2_02_FULL_46_20]|uniref:AAA family ATPase n=2 Tax=Saganbacteria TaxID=1703751 RepID=A0A1F4RGG3_UNCSA|nr:MAG: AAA family ATPase [candidate division WOR-1 bacterium RIFCSPHIGHO2_02_FULL_45_12]OGC07304.1 MAG: AAA family ATPase [candidate division WOR-1 bacterium RIFCSPLOWO2_02_FULL_46_20]OGC08447.1 MAG: AAA family ATPase [candidate division WOR-1 bacterium RIFCSPLOWO2_12_FULL_45_9]